VFCHCREVLISSAVDRGESVVLLSKPKKRFVEFEPCVAG
jgi:hypothetical protein